MYERLIASLRICQRMSKLEDSCIMLEDGACDGYPNCMIDLMDAAADAIEKLSADVQPVKWIPFSVRDLDEEEKAEHPEWDCILDGELPEDGQRILVNVKFKGHESVQMDEFYSDCDGSYLDSGYEIGTEVTHWMPLPEPPKGDNP